MPEIKICPKCKTPVEASDFMNTTFFVFGGLDPKIRCKKCGYRGLPISLTDRLPISTSDNDEKT